MVDWLSGATRPPISDTMKKLFLFIITMLCSLSFISCEKGGDVIKGTWKGPAGINSSTSAATELDLTYIFDGKGNFKYISIAEEERVSTGTYVIEENNTIVRLHGVARNYQGEEYEYDSELMLDLESNPPTLSAHLYDSNGTYYGLLVFEKQ